MSRPVLNWVACGIMLLGFSGVVRAAYTFDRINDDFIRTDEQLLLPNDKHTVADYHFHWSEGNTVWAKDTSGDNVPESMGIYQNGYLTMDLSVAGIASGRTEITTQNEITPQTRFYTYEVRLTVDQFAGPNGSIVIASVRNGYFDGANQSLPGSLAAYLKAEELDIATTGSTTFQAINVTTELGKAYTWRFIVDQQNGTVDIYRRANDSDPFSTIVTNQIYYSAPHYSPQASISAAYGTGDTQQAKVSFDYVRLGSNAVPEPATLGLLALGGMALLTRRRRHS